MTINPTTLALGIPIASSALKSFGRIGKGFLDQLIAKSSDSSIEPSTSAGTASLQDRLKQLATSLRSFLAQHGVDGTYSVRISAESSAILEVEGNNNREISALLSSDPKRIGDLKQLVQSIDGVSQSLGRGPGRLVITDQEEHIEF